MKERCRNLVVDNDGDYWCRSTHICFRPYCDKTIFGIVKHKGGDIYETDINDCS